jgi:DNA-binding transcriptional LysR family regulator
MLGYNLDYLRTFYYVAQYSGITKAANILCVSQPSVTYAIKKLEEALDTVLFDRNSKGLFLTSEGKILYEHVSAAIERVMLGEQSLSLAKKHSRGTLRIAATETPLYHLIIPKVKDFQVKHPDIFISISGGSSVDDAFAQVESEKVDLAFGVSPVSEVKNLDITADESFSDIVICDKTFLETIGGRELTLRELCEFPLITTPRETNARKHLDSFLAEHGVLFEPTYTVHTSTSILAFALHGLGIGILPIYFAERLIASGELFTVELKNKLPQRNIIIARKKISPLSGISKLFLEFLAPQ